MNECQRHGHCSSPYRFVFQIPSHFVDTTVAEGMAGDGISALERQWLTENDVVVRAICSTTSDLEWSEKLNQLLRQIIN